MLVWLGLSLIGCTGDDGVDAIEDEGVGECYIQLNLNTAGKPMTRAAYGDDRPYGGEGGDGNEVGHNHENDINNINIFIYNGTGVNDAANTEIKFAKFFSYLNLTEIVAGQEYETMPLLIHGYKQATGDRIIVFVNMGDMTSVVDANGDGTITLGEVRNAEVSHAWATSGSSINDCYNFAMASAIDGNVDGVDQGAVNIAQAGTYDDPFSANVTVERVAARIDFAFATSQEASGYRAPITYNVVDEATGTATDDIFRLSHIRIVNGSQMPTYTLKRVAETVNPLGTVTYLGDEEVATSTHIPTNYVVEPRTTLKKEGATLAATDLATWYGASSFQNSLATDFLISPSYKVHSTKTTVADDEVFEADGNYCYTLGYVMENTMDKSTQSSINSYYLMTAIEIKGTYIPETVYKWDAGTSDKTADASYTAGSDFWYYQNTTSPEYSYAFSSEADLLSYADSKTDTYVKHHYVNGECYYYVWIRHAMFDSSHPSGSYPMEYGIVRNNIYRIYVEKVLQIGPEKPVPDMPDLITSSVYVRRWRFRPHSEINL